MSYSPTTWQNGDTITAAKLNNMESGISAGENGWEVTSSTTQLFSESVTTSEMNGLSGANLVYSTAITADPLTVTMDGTDYSCSAYRDEDNMGPFNYYGGFGAGGPDFTNYPFFLMAGDDGTNTFVTTADGTYTVAAVTSSTTVTTTANFQTAAQAAVGGMAPFRIVLDTTTFQEAYDAMAAGRMAFVDRLSYNGMMEPVIYVRTGNYSVVCLHYYNGVSTATYSAASADSAIASS